MQVWDVILDALIDTAKILPILFLVYYLIELFEYKCAKKLQKSKLLKGKASPVFGSLIGCIPQCGFSVISTDLFSKGIISVGALVAVFIATSDEAIPIMFSNPKMIGWMFLLIGIKIVVAILVGYLASGLYRVIFKHKVIVEEENHHNHNEELSKEENNKETIEDAHEHGGCCHHHVETKSFDWLHPMLHSLKIGAFILVINLLFGFLVAGIGEENLTNFLSGSVAFQPLLAVLIGLIPNCASSVVLTELFVVGGLKFSALVAGLCVNAGLGVIMLLKQNKNWKENLFIISIILIPSLIIGYALLFI